MMLVVSTCEQAVIAAAARTDKRVFFNITKKLMNGSVAYFGSNYMSISTFTSPQSSTVGFMPLAPGRRIEFESVETDEDAARIGGVMNLGRHRVVRVAVDPVLLCTAGQDAVDYDLGGDCGDGAMADRSGIRPALSWRRFSAPRKARCRRSPTNGPGPEASRPPYRRACR